MKIIEYTLGLPPFRRGGLPRYSMDLSKELAKNNEVYLMYPGQINPYSKKIKLSQKKSKYLFKIIEMKNPLPVSLGLGVTDEKYYIESRDISELKKLVEKIKPEVIHFHTLMGVPKEFLEYLHNIKIRTVYTTHDFYGLCPKMLSKDPMKELVSSKCSYDCMLCNIGPSYKKILIMQSHLYKCLKEKKLVQVIRSKNKTNISTNTESVSINLTQAALRYKLRKYYLEMFKLIDIFHFNSSISQKYFQKFLPNVNGKVIPITHSRLKDDRQKRIYKKHKTIHLGYVGPYDRKKGFFLYTNILKEIAKKYNFKADFYGDVVDRNIFQDKQFVNHGVISSEKLQREYQKIDILIVPSLWHETFGYVVLEALLEGTPCLVSDNVGAKDLVPIDWRFRNSSDLKSDLINIISNSDCIENMIKKTARLKLSYEMDKHVKDIMNELYI